MSIWAHFFAANRKKPGFAGLRAPAPAAPWLNPFNPLRGSTSGKPEVNIIQVWRFAAQNAKVV
jgi:hypothetical protein